MTKEYVEKRLLEIGIPASYKGFDYITDAIMLLLNPKWDCNKITAIYHALASKNNTSPQNIEHCMRTTFKTARNEGNEITEKYLGKHLSNNKNTLFTLFRYLSLEKGGAVA